VTAVKLCGVLREVERDRRRRPDRAARAIRLEAPSGLPCNPKYPSCGVTYHAMTSLSHCGRNKKRSDAGARRSVTCQQEP